MEDGTSFAVTVRDNDIAGSARDGILLDGVGGSVDSNTITDSGAFGLLLQGATATATGNAITGSTLDDLSMTSAGHGPVQIPPPSP